MDVRAGDAHSSMRPWAVGTDIISVQRVRALLALQGSSRWFTEAERRYCNAKTHPEQHLAGRLAAKEAVFKALGLPGDRAIPWAQIEVVSGPKRPPQVVLHGDLGELAATAAIAINLSISHCEEFATATAITVPAPPLQTSTA